MYVLLAIATYSWKKGIIFQTRITILSQPILSTVAGYEFLFEPG